MRDVATLERHILNLVLAMAPQLGRNTPQLGTCLRPGRKGGHPQLTRTWLHSTWGTHPHMHCAAKMDQHDGNTCFSDHGDHHGSAFVTRLAGKGHRRDAQVVLTRSFASSMKLFWESKPSGGPAAPRNATCGHSKSTLCRENITTIW